MNNIFRKLPYLILCHYLAVPLFAGNADGELEIHWIDVEGGAATLLVTPAGESILIDSGNAGGRDARRIFAATQAADLARIDHHIVSHFHSDHFGGSAELAALIPITNIYDNGIPEGHPDQNFKDQRWGKLIKAYRDIPATRHVLKAGYDIPLKQGGGSPAVRLICAAAMQGNIPLPHGTPSNPLAGQLVEKDIAYSENDNSNVLMLDFGAFRFISPGDLTWNLEGALVTPANRLGQVDVYQTSHHGREDSNNTVFIHSLAPTVSVMNNGIRKGAMTDAINGLKSSPGIKAMYQVHKNLRPAEGYNNTSDEFIANFSDDPKSCHGHGITLTVAADSLTYTVGIIAHGSIKTFHTRLK